MKAVFFHFNYKFSSPLVRKIIRDNGITEVHNFWPIKIDDGSMGDIRILERSHETNELFSGNFKTIAYNKLLPLDSVLLRKLSAHEWDAKKIIARFTKITPHVVKKKQSFFFRYIDKFARYVGYEHNSDVMPAGQRDEIYNRMVRFWNDFFLQNKIDVVISELIPHGAMDYIGYRVAQLHGVPVVAGYFAHSTLNMYLFADHERNRDDIRETFDDLKRTIAPGELKLSEQSLNELKRIADKILPYTGDPKTVSEMLDKMGKNPFKMGNPLKKLSLIKRILNERKSRLDRLYSQLSSLPDLGETEFFYFPLSAQPEASSLPIGGYYCNQLLIAEMVNYYLPDNCRLFIKEHSFESEQEYRSEEFYLSLSKLDKVVLVPKHISTFDLIRHCKAVVTIASTASWEGLQMGKPCLFFGYHITQYSPGAFMIRSKEDCAAAIRTIADGYQIDKNDLLYFVRALEIVCAKTAVDQFVYNVKTMSDEEWVLELSRYFNVCIKKGLEKQL